MPLQLAGAPVHVLGRPREFSRPSQFHIYRPIIIDHREGLDLSLSSGKAYRLSLLRHLRQQIQSTASSKVGYLLIVECMIKFRLPA